MSLMLMVILLIWLSAPLSSSHATRDDESLVCYCTEARCVQTNYMCKVKASHSSSSSSSSSSSCYSIIKLHPTLHQVNSVVHGCSGGSGGGGISSRGGSSSDKGGKEVSLQNDLSDVHLNNDICYGFNDDDDDDDDDEDRDAGGDYNGFDNDGDDDYGNDNDEESGGESRAAAADEYVGRKIERQPKLNNIDLKNKNIVNNNDNNLNNNNDNNNNNSNNNNLTRDHIKNITIFNNDIPSRQYRHHVGSRKNKPNYKTEKKVKKTRKTISPANNSKWRRRPGNSDVRVYVSCCRSDLCNYMKNKITVDISEDDEDEDVGKDGNEDYAGNDDGKDDDAKTNNIVVQIDESSYSDDGNGLVNVHKSLRKNWNKLNGDEKERRTKDSDSSIGHVNNSSSSSSSLFISTLHLSSSSLPSSSFSSSSSSSSSFSSPDWLYVASFVVPILGAIILVFVVITALKLLRNSSNSSNNNNIGSSNSNYNYDACVCSCCNDTYCYNIVCDDDNKYNNGINYSGSTSTCSFNNKNNNNNNNPDINNQPQRGCICDKTLNPVCSHRYSINIVLLPDDVNSRRMLLPASRCSSCTRGGYSRGYHGLHQTILQWIYRKCKSSMAGRSSDENAELFCSGERNKSTNHASDEPPSDERFFSSRGNKLYCLSEHLLVEDFKNLKSLPETSIKMNPPIHDVL